MAFGLIGYQPKRYVSDAKCSLSIKDCTTSLRNGDILLVCSHSFASSIVNTVCSSRFSHVGIIFVDQFGKRWVLESIKSDDTIPPLVERSLGPNTGVRMVELIPYLQRFNGECIAARVLQMRKEIADKLYFEFDRYMHSIIEQVYQEKKGTPYKRDYRDFLTARFSWLGGRPTNDLSTIFCSELVTYIYKRAGILPDDDTIPCQYTPDNYDHASNLQLVLPPDIQRICFSSRKKLIKLSEEKYIQVPSNSRNMTQAYHIFSSYKVKIRGIIIFLIVVAFCLYLILI